MIPEREFLITVLRLTKGGPIDYSLVSKNARMPSQTAERLVKEHVNKDLVKLQGKVLDASPDQRVEIAVRALKLGADFERVCRQLKWREFESVSTAAFKAYNYNVIRNLWFKGDDGKRWEIDLLALKRPLIASVDCKHWKHRWTRGQIMKTVKKHTERTKAFADVLPKLYPRISLNKWKHVTIVPIVLSLLRSNLRFHHDTPIVPVLQLQSFLSELPGHVEFLTHFCQEIRRINREITEYWQEKP